MHKYYCIRRKIFICTYGPLYKGKQSPGLELCNPDADKNNKDEKRLVDCGSHNLVVIQDWYSELWKGRLHVS